MLNKATTYYSLTFKSIFIFSICLLFVIPVFSQHKDPITFSVKPFRNNGFYTTDDTKIGCVIRLFNDSSQVLEGTVLCRVTNENNIPVFTDTSYITIKDGGSFYKTIRLNKTLLKPGIYEVQAFLNTPVRKDSLYYAIGYNAEQYRSSNQPPNDLSLYWQDAKKELASIPPNYSINKRTDLADKYSDVYQITFQSAGNINIKSWLTIPKEKGIFPLLMQVPNFLQPAIPDKRREVAVFSIDPRGSGNSADPIRADSAGFLLWNINQKQSYIFRSLYLDCVRGLEFIYSQGATLKIDTTKVTVAGEGIGATLAAAAVALNGKPKGLYLQNPLMIDMPSLLALSEQRKAFSWPVNLFQNYIHHPNSTDNASSFFYTWRYFDPLYLASQIHCNVLIQLGGKSSSYYLPCIYHFYTRLNTSQKEIYVCPDCNNALKSTFYTFRDMWLNEVF
ncbi:MAG: acetylxylan esterase [Bacteroidota bacterium]|nr:acetylxylan esterase [Bacteroidota bacterium]